MPYNLLLLPLIGGYWFLHTIHYTRFRSQGLDGYRLLLESAFAGVLLGFTSHLILFLFGQAGSVADLIGSLWSRFLPFPYSGTTSGALLLGLGLPYVINLLYPEKRAKERALEHHGTELLKLFQTSVVDHKPVEITLENRKYYVGYVTRSPSPDRDESYFSLVPLISGFRSGEDLSAKHLVNYESIYAEPGRNMNDFAVVLPIEKVLIARLFDKTAWAEFAKPRKQTLQP